MNQIAAQLRESAARQRAGAPEGAAVPVADELDQAAAEIERLYITVEELEAIAYVELCLRCEINPICERHTAALRSLLQRLGGKLG